MGEGLRYYFELIQIAIVAEALLYEFPLYFILRDFPTAFTILVIYLLLLIYTYKYNETFHVLLEKWKGDD